MFENTVLRMICGAKLEFWGTEENYILSSFLTQCYWGDQMDMLWIGHVKCLMGKSIFAGFSIFSGQVLSLYVQIVTSAHLEIRK